MAQDQDVFARLGPIPQCPRSPVPTGRASWRSGRPIEPDVVRPMCATRMSAPGLGLHRLVAVEHIGSGQQIHLARWKSLHFAAVARNGLFRLTRNEPSNKPTVGKFWTPANPAAFTSARNRSIRRKGPCRRRRPTRACCARPGASRAISDDGVGVAEREQSGQRRGRPCGSGRV